MHEHKTIMTMDGEFCPTCGKFLKDIPTKEKPKPKKQKRQNNPNHEGREVTRPF